MRQTLFICRDWKNSWAPLECLEIKALTASPCKRAHVETSTCLKRGTGGWMHPAPSHWAGLDIHIHTNHEKPFALAWTEVSPGQIQAYLARINIGHIHHVFIRPPRRTPIAMQPPSASSPPSGRSSNANCLRGHLPVPSIAKSWLYSTTPSQLNRRENLIYHEKQNHISCITPRSCS